MNATNARGKSKTAAPVPEKGVLIREPAICDQCKRKCTVSQYGGGSVHGYYTYYDDKLCKVCIKGVI